MGVHDVVYTPSVTGAAFMRSDARMRVFMGPVGCISGDTLICTERGNIPMRSIDSSTLVLSWDATGGRFVYSSTSGSFRKGTDYLYRVSTQRGVFDAAGFHRVYGAGGNYERVDSLYRGQFLSQYSGSLHERELVGVPVGFVGGVRRCLGRFLGYLGGYVGSIRLCGRPLRSHVGAVPLISPLRGDVLGLPASLCRGVYGRLDDYLVRSQSHSHLVRPVCQIGTDGLGFRSGSLHGVGGGSFFSSLYGHIWGRVLRYSRYLWTTFARLTVRLLVLCFGSSLCSISKGAITSIERKEVKETYWDIQVLDTNNYVTVDGTIHHNSGKSVTSCIELVRRASMQAPNEYGIRKSRAAVVRQTARQLTDTTIKTFCDWFPPTIYGDYMRTSKTYYFKLGDVELEIMFRALDDANDVANLSSLELTFAWFNECRDISPEIIEAMSKRVGRFPSIKDGGPSWYGVWADTNPPTMETWWYYQMEGLDPNDGVSFIDNKWDVFKQPSGRSALAENVENLVEGYYDTTGRAEDYIRVYIDGEYGVSLSGQPVYKYFRPDYHMAKGGLEPILNGSRPLIVGMDLGLTPAAVFGQMDAFGRALIYDELVSWDMGVQRFTRTMLKPLLYSRFAGAPVLIVVDPAGTQRAQTDERRAVDIIRAEGLMVIPASTNKVTARLSAVDSYLMRQVEGKSGFLIDPRCKNLKSAMMGGYRFHKKTGKIDKDRRHSHIAEALQYLMLHIDSHNGANAVQAREVKRVSAVGWT